MDNKEQNLITYGEKIDVIIRECILSKLDYEEMSEETKRFLDEWNSIESAPIFMNPNDFKEKK